MENKEINVTFVLSNLEQVQLLLKSMKTEFPKFNENKFILDDKLRETLVRMKDKKSYLKVNSEMLKTHLFQTKKELQDAYEIAVNIISLYENFISEIEKMNIENV